MLATGKHDLRGARRLLRRPPQALVGFKTHVRLAPRQTEALASAVELTLFPDAYVGLQRVDAHTANLCLLADAERLARDGSWDGLLAGLCAESMHLAQRLAHAECWPRPLAIARVPYGFLHRPAPDDDPHLYRLGDQMAVIASFTGDGMAIALHTARLAASCLLAGFFAPEYHGRAARHLGRPTRLAAALYAAGRVPWLQSGMMHVARWWPGSLAAVGRLTRVAA
jgi:hypothetical protein